MVARAVLSSPLAPRVYLRRPSRGDQPAFLAAVATSRRLHGRWVSAPADAAAYASYVARFASRQVEPRYVGLLVFEASSDALAGVFNFSEIVRGALQSCYLGYYAFAPLAGKGLMHEGLHVALDVAFGPLGLHRVEANVQPANRRSLQLVTSAGFTREGYSRRYLQLGEQWRDHVRMAMLADDWPRLRRLHRPGRPRS